LRAPAAEIGIDGALDDSKQRLVALAVGRDTPSEPSKCVFDSLGGLRVARREGCALIERHDDVGAERVLDLDGPLGGQVDLAPVHLAPETRTVFVNRLSGEAENLVAP
jgi:hypothetical protein